MPRVLLITNPMASRYDADVVRAVSLALEAEGWEADVAGTTRPRDAARIAAQGVGEKVDVIAVYGGDGTAMEAVAGMVGSGLPLALVPGGTGNLLACNLGIPIDPAAAARIITRGTRRPVDIGRVDREEGPRYFAVAAGAGLDAEIMRGATPERKKRWGSGAYVGSTIAALEQLTPVRYRVTVDGTSSEVDATTAVIANCGWIANVGIRLGPGITLDDGWLDLVALKAGGIVDTTVLLWELYARPGNGAGRISRFRGREITVESATPRAVQMDGDLAGTTPFTAKILPRGIDVLVGQG